MFPLPEGVVWKTLLITVFCLIIKEIRSEPRVVCYYTNWSVYRPGTAKFNPQNINPYLCTHLVYAFGGFTKDNTLKPFDKYQDIEQGGYAKFTGLKSYNKQLKTMLAIGGWNEGSSRFSPLMAHQERRQQFVKNILKFLRQNHFDGLDLDWEYPAYRDGGKPRDRDNYAQFVQELRAEFDRESSKTGRPRLLITMAVPAGIEYIEKGYDIPKLNKYLDWFNILSYDYHSAYEPSVNHHAPLYSLEEDSEYNYDGELNIDYTVKHYLNAGAERDKIVLGIPTYGRSYTLINSESNDIGSPSDGPGEQGDATREKGYLAYYEICQNIKEDPDWTVIQPNSKAMGPYAYKKDQWVGYDDEDIVRRKAEYVADNRLGGIMFWSIDNDDFRGSCNGKPYPLIEAAKEALLDKLGFGDNEVSQISSQQKPSRSRSRKGPANQNKLQIDKADDESSSIQKKPNRKRPTTKATSTTTSRRPVAGRTTTPEPPTTPDPGSDFKCEEEGFFPHPRDCKKYFWCLDSGPSNLGIVAHQFTCPSGLYFNPAADSCDFSRNVLCKKSKTTSASKTSTTTTPASFISIKPPTTTRPKISRPSTTTTTTTTTEAAYEDDYEDNPNEEIAAKYSSEEDPKVIKDLIDLIKKVGGVEELEKLLQQDGSSVTLRNTPGSESTTPPTISKSLYDRVLGHTNKYTSIKNRFKSIKLDKTVEKEDAASTDDQENNNSSQNSNKYSSVIRNSRPNSQSAGLEKLQEFDGFLREKPKYVTIRRTTPKPIESDDNKEVSNDYEEDDDDSDDSYLRNVKSSSTIAVSSTPSYQNIKRIRPAFSQRPSTLTASTTTTTESIPDVSSSTEKLKFNRYKNIERTQRPSVDEAIKNDEETTDDVITLNLKGNTAHTTQSTIDDKTLNESRITPKIQTLYRTTTISNDYTTNNVNLTANITNELIPIQSNPSTTTVPDIIPTENIPSTSYSNLDLDLSEITESVLELTTPTIPTTTTTSTTSTTPSTTTTSTTTTTTTSSTTRASNSATVDISTDLATKDRLTDGTLGEDDEVIFNKPKTQNNFEPSQLNRGKTDRITLNRNNSTKPFNRRISTTPKNSLSEVSGDKINESPVIVSSPRPFSFPRRRNRPASQNPILTLDTEPSSTISSKEVDVKTDKVSHNLTHKNSSESSLFSSTLDKHFLDVNNLEPEKAQEKTKIHTNTKSPIKKLPSRPPLIEENETTKPSKQYSWRDPRIGNYRPWRDKKSAKDPFIQNNGQYDPSLHNNKVTSTKFEYNQVQNTPIKTKKEKKITDSLSESRFALNQVSNTKSFDETSDNLNIDRNTGETVLRTSVKTTLKPRKFITTKRSLGNKLNINGINTNQEESIKNKSNLNLNKRKPSNYKHSFENDSQLLETSKKIELEENEQSNFSNIVTKKYTADSTNAPETTTTSDDATENPFENFNENSTENSSGISNEENYVTIASSSVKQHRGISQNKSEEHLKVLETDSSSTDTIDDFKFNSNYSVKDNISSHNEIELKNINNAEATMSTEKNPSLPYNPIDLNSGLLGNQSILRINQIYKATLDKPFNDNNNASNDNKLDEKRSLTMNQTDILDETEEYFSSPSEYYETTEPISFVTETTRESAKDLKVDSENKKIPFNRKRIFIENKIAQKVNETIKLVKQDAELDVNEDTSKSHVNTRNSVSSHFFNTSNEYDSNENSDLQTKETSHILNNELISNSDRFRFEAGSDEILNLKDSTNETKTSDSSLKTKANIYSRNRVVLKTASINAKNLPSTIEDTLSNDNVTILTDKPSLIDTADNSKIEIKTTLRNKLSTTNLRNSIINNNNEELNENSEQNFDDSNNTSNYTNTYETSTKKIGHTSRTENRYQPTYKSRAILSKKEIGNEKVALDEPRKPFYNYNQQSQSQDTDETEIETESKSEGNYKEITRRVVVTKQSSNENLENDTPKKTYSWKDARIANFRPWLTTTPSTTTETETEIFFYKERIPLEDENKGARISPRPSKKSRVLNLSNKKNSITQTDANIEVEKVSDEENNVRLVTKNQRVINRENTELKTRLKTTTTKRPTKSVTFSSRTITNNVNKNFEESVQEKSIDENEKATEKNEINLSSLEKNAEELKNEPNSIVTTTESSTIKKPFTFKDRKLFNNKKIISTFNSTEKSVESSKASLISLSSDANNTEISNGSKIVETTLTDDTDKEKLTTPTEFTTIKKPFTLLKDRKLFSNKKIISSLNSTEKSVESSKPSLISLSSDENNTEIRNGSKTVDTTSTDDTDKEQITTRTESSTIKKTFTVKDRKLLNNKKIISSLNSTEQSEEAPKSSFTSLSSDENNTEIINSSKTIETTLTDDTDKEQPTTPIVPIYSRKLETTDSPIYYIGKVGPKSIKINKDSKHIFDLHEKQILDVFGVTHGRNDTSKNNSINSKQVLFKKKRIFSTTLKPDNNLLDKNNDPEPIEFNSDGKNNFASSKEEDIENKKQNLHALNQTLIESNKNDSNENLRTIGFRPKISVLRKYNNSAIDSDVAETANTENRDEQKESFFTEKQEISEDYLPETVTEKADTKTLKFNSRRKYVNINRNIGSLKTDTEDSTQENLDNENLSYDKTTEEDIERQKNYKQNKYQGYKTINRRKNVTTHASRKENQDDENNVHEDKSLSSDSLTESVTDTNSKSKRKYILTSRIRNNAKSSSINSSNNESLEIVNIDSGIQLNNNNSRESIDNDVPKINLGLNRKYSSITRNKTVPTYILKVNKESTESSFSENSTSSPGNEQTSTSLIDNEESTTIVSKMEEDIISLKNFTSTSTDHKIVGGLETNGSHLPNKTLIHLVKTTEVLNNNTQISLETNKNSVNTKENQINSVNLEFSSENIEEATPLSNINVVSTTEYNEDSTELNLQGDVNLINSDESNDDVTEKASNEENSSNLSVSEGFNLKANTTANRKYLEINRIRNTIKNAADHSKLNIPLNNGSKNIEQQEDDNTGGIYLDEKKVDKINENKLNVNEKVRQTYTPIRRQNSTILSFKRIQNSALGPNVNSQKEFEEHSKEEKLEGSADLESEDEITEKNVVERTGSPIKSNSISNRKYVALNRKTNLVKNATRRIQLNIVNNGSKTSEQDEASTNPSVLNENQEDLTNLKAKDSVRPKYASISRKNSTILSLNKIHEIKRPIENDENFTETNLEVAVDLVNSDNNTDDLIEANLKDENSRLNFKTNSTFKKYNKVTKRIKNLVRNSTDAQSLTLNSSPKVYKLNEEEEYNTEQSLTDKKEVELNNRKSENKLNVKGRVRPQFTPIIRKSTAILSTKKTEEINISNENEEHVTDESIAEVTERTLTDENLKVSSKTNSISRKYNIVTNRINILANNSAGDSQLNNSLSNGTKIAEEKEGEEEEEDSTDETYTDEREDDLNKINQNKLNFSEKFGSKYSPVNRKNSTISSFYRNQIRSKSEEKINSTLENKDQLEDNKELEESTEKITRNFKPNARNYLSLNRKVNISENAKEKEGQEEEEDSTDETYTDDREDDLNKINQNKLNVTERLGSKYSPINRKNSTISSFYRNQIRSKSEEKINSTLENKDQLEDNKDLEESTEKITRNFKPNARNYLSLNRKVNISENTKEKEGQEEEEDSTDETYTDDREIDLNKINQNKLNVTERLGSKYSPINRKNSTISSFYRNQIRSKSEEKINSTLENKDQLEDNNELEESTEKITRNFRPNVRNYLSLNRKVNISENISESKTNTGVDQVEHSIENLETVKLEEKEESIKSKPKYNRTYPNKNKSKSITGDQNIEDSTNKLEEISSTTRRYGYISRKKTENISETEEKNAEDQTAEQITSKTLGLPTSDIDSATTATVISNKRLSLNSLVGKKRIENLLKESTESKLNEKSDSNAQNNFTKSIVEEIGTISSNVESNSKLANRSFNRKPYERRKIASEASTESLPNETSNNETGENSSSLKVSQVSSRTSLASSRRYNEIERKTSNLFSQKRSTTTAKPKDLNENLGIDDYVESTTIFPRTRNYYRPKYLQINKDSALNQSKVNEVKKDEEYGDDYEDDEADDEDDNENEDDENNETGTDNALTTEKSEVASEDKSNSARLNSLNNLSLTKILQVNRRFGNRTTVGGHEAKNLDDLDNKTETTSTLILNTTKIGLENRPLTNLLRRNNTNINQGRFSSNLDININKINDSNNLSGGDDGDVLEQNINNTNSKNISSLNLKRRFQKLNNETTSGNSEPVPTTNVTSESSPDKTRRIKLLKFRRPVSNSLPTDQNESQKNNNVSVGNEIREDNNETNRTHNYIRKKLIRKKPVNEITTTAPEVENPIKNNSTRGFRKVIRKVLRTRVNSTENEENNLNLITPINSGRDQDESKINTPKLTPSKTFERRKPFKPTRLLLNSTLTSNVTQESVRPIERPRNVIKTYSSINRQRNTTRLNKLKVEEEKNYDDENDDDDDDDKDDDEEEEEEIKEAPKILIPSISNVISPINRFNRTKFQSNVVTQKIENINKNEEEDEDGDGDDEGEDDDDEDEEDDENEDDNNEENVEQKSNQPTRNFKLNRPAYIPKSISTSDNDKKKSNVPIGYNRAALKRITSRPTNKPKFVTKPLVADPIPVGTFTPIQTTPALFKSTNTKNYERKYYASSTENASSQPDNSLLEDLNVDALNARNKKIFEKTSKKHTTVKPKTIKDLQGTNYSNTNNENEQSLNNSSITLSNSIDSNESTETNINNITTSNTLKTNEDSAIVNYSNEQNLNNNSIIVSVSTLTSQSTETNNDNLNEQNINNNNITISSTIETDESNEVHSSDSINNLNEQNLNNINITTSNTIDINDTNEIVEANNLNNNLQEDVIEFSITNNESTENPITTTTAKYTTLTHVFSVDQDTTTTEMEVSTNNINEEKLVEINRIVEVSSKENKIKIKNSGTDSINETETKLKIEIPSHTDKLGEISRVRLINVAEHSLQNGGELVIESKSTLADYTPTEPNKHIVKEFIPVRNSIPFVYISENVIEKKGRQLKLPEVLEVETSTISLEGLFDNTRQSKDLNIEKNLVYATSLGEVIQSNNSNSINESSSSSVTVSSSSSTSTNLETNKNSGSNKTTNSILNSDRNINYIRPIVPLLRPESNESSPLIRFQNRKKRPALSARRKLPSTTSIPKELTTLITEDSTSYPKYNRRPKPTYFQSSPRTRASFESRATTISPRLTTETIKSVSNFASRRKNVRATRKPLQSRTVLDDQEIPTTISPTLTRSSNSIFRRRTPSSVLSSIAPTTITPKISVTTYSSPFKDIILTNIDQEAKSSIQVPNKKYNYIADNSDEEERIVGVIKAISNAPIPSTSSISTTSTIAPKKENTTTQNSKHQARIAKPTIIKKESNTNNYFDAEVRALSTVASPKKNHINRKPEAFEKLNGKLPSARTYKPVLDYDYYDDEDIRIVGKSNSQVKVILHGKGIIECLDQGNFPHPISCRKFISCAKMETGGVIGWEYTCPKGLSYDPVGGICNWSSGLGCKE